ncbi:PilN domain-containing protein [Halodesulfovibrio sp.]|jgi:Tfp pilus assembly protein PilN|uniref:PilN domain-containing protein n=1 Tax=Halodesulfovibrio sp. TaxID=1912772 RepID=UPI0025CF313F|nr:PilN domain-containing protein [Halodesulfovibrio sp.]MCT4535225.1 PilN domain-containing protein [Halodesulfovibrio sp.]
MLVVDCSNVTPVLFAVEKKRTGNIRQQLVSLLPKKTSGSSDEYSAVACAVLSAISSDDVEGLAKEVRNFCQKHEIVRPRCVIICPQHTVLHSYSAVPVKSGRNAKRVLANDIDRKIPALQGALRIQSVPLGRRADRLFSYGVFASSSEHLEFVGKIFGEHGIAVTGFDSPVSAFCRSLAAIKENFPAVLTMPHDEMLVGLQGTVPVYVQQQSANDGNEYQQLMRCLYRLKQVGITPLAHQKMTDDGVEASTVPPASLLPLVQPTFIPAAEALYRKMVDVLPEGVTDGQRRVLVGACLNSPLLPSRQKSVASLGVKQKKESTAKKGTVSPKTMLLSVGLLGVSLLLLASAHAVKLYRATSYYESKTEELIYNAVAQRYKKASRSQKIRIIKSEITELKTMASTQGHSLLSVFEVVSAKLPAKSSLTRFVKTAKGFELSGRTKDSSKVDVFVTALKQQHIFSDVVIARRAVKKNAVEFTIALSMSE